jgi:hypothetical protein
MPYVVVLFIIRLLATNQFITEPTMATTAITTIISKTIFQPSSL